MVKIYGRYCGPNWTAGKARAAKDTPESEFFRVRPIDALDNACRSHDFRCKRDGGCTSNSDRLLANSANNVANDPKESKETRIAARVIRDGIMIASRIRLK
jgi:hypothetical protein